MDGKVIIRSSGDGVNGSTVYSYTLQEGNVIVCKEVNHVAIAEIIKKKYPVLEGRIKEYFNIGIDLPEELSHLDPTPQTQLIKQIVGLVNAIEKYYDHEEENKVLIKDEQKPGHKEKRKKKTKV